MPLIDLIKLLCGKTSVKNSVYNYVLDYEIITPLLHIK